MLTRKKQQADIKQLLFWVDEAQEAHSDWRSESWEDYEFRDGKQWSQADYERSKSKGIRALTINRTFPIINLIQGHYINNKTNLVCKGRTKEDNELGQVMSEALHFIGDQNNAEQKLVNAFNDQIIPGFGCLSVGFSSDPRQEKIQITSHPWYSIWWDPFSTPWMEKNKCRYAFKAEWTNLKDLISLFPEYESKINEQFGQLTTEYFAPNVYDEGTRVEEKKRYLTASNWAKPEENRVRPVEMWYTHLTKSWFAIMPNDRVIDLDAIENPEQEFALIMQSKEVVQANVKKMRVAIFLGDLLLQDCCTPYIHDDYPFVPFVGYLDRFGFPFGIPRQIKEQDSEVNKRRSMALSLLSSRRVITEEGAAEDANRTHAEANRHDGFIVMKKGKLDRIRIDDLSNLSNTQMDALQQSENEIQEIAGTNDESLGYKTPKRSGVALEQQKQSSATVTASLLDNAKYSKLNLGNKIMSLVQDTWTDEKVLRVTDRITGAEKFVSVNERFYDGTDIVVRNDITQATFDLVASETPMTDTMREKNQEAIFAAINKSPPEAVGPLLNLALELSDIPNKDLLLDQVRKATGVFSINDNLSLAEREEQDRLLAEQQAQQEQKEIALQDMEVALEQDKLRAEAEELRAEAARHLALANVAKQDVDQKGFQIGQQTAQMTRNNVKEDTYTPRGEASHPENPKPKGVNNDATAGSSS